MNFFLRETHSARHFIQSTSSWAVSSGETSAVPARRGVKYAMFFAICGEEVMLTFSHTVLNGLMFKVKVLTEAFVSVIF